MEGFIFKSHNEETYRDVKDFIKYAYLIFNERQKGSIRERFVCSVSNKGEELVLK